jgi:hypothetical protein
LDCLTPEMEALHSETLVIFNSRQRGTYPIKPISSDVL